MSKKWKVAIGAVVAAVIVAGVALAVWGLVTFREWRIEHREWGPEAATQLEVRLVDDDGDGVPDRGVIEVPEDLQLGWGHGPLLLRRGSRQAMPFGFAQYKLRGGPHFGHGFGPHFGRGFGPHFGRGFGPFLIMGGLFRLAFLALLIGLAVACFRCWRRTKEAREPERG